MAALAAGALRLDQNRGIRGRQNASLRFRASDSLYTDLHLPDRRPPPLQVSLVPSVGYSRNTGVDVSVPCYLNLARTTISALTRVRCRNAA